MIRLAAILALALAAGCGSKKPATTPAPTGGDGYGGESYGADEPDGEPRPDPCGGDPCGY